MKAKYLFSFVFYSVFASCGGQTRSDLPSRQPDPATIKNSLNDSGTSVLTRINTPKGYDRIPQEKKSFGTYLRQRELQAPQYKVHYFDGREKKNDVYIAVLKIDVGNKDLQQCADAVMRLRAEYFYQLRNYDSIHFKLTNGFDVPFSRWMQGLRVKINGNHADWVSGSTTGNDYNNFRKYLDFIFSYAGTLSLERSLHNKSVTTIIPGDVFVQGGSPGHAVMVMDVAENRNGDRVFLLAQSYMPAQEIHILKNLENAELSPWFRLLADEELKTPEWNFPVGSLKSWNP